MNTPKTPAQTETKTPVKSPTSRKTSQKTPATKITPAMRRTLNFLAKTPTPKKTKATEDLQGRSSAKTPAKTQPDRKIKNKTPGTKMTQPQKFTIGSKVNQIGERRETVNVKEGRRGGRYKWT